jgi:hypothetical protein
MGRVKLYTISQAADYAGVARTTIYAWLDRGKRRGKRLFYLPGVYLKGLLWVRQDELDEFLDHIGYEPVDDE